MDQQRTVGHGGDRRGQSVHRVSTHDAALQEGRRAGSAPLTSTAWGACGDESAVSGQAPRQVGTFELEEAGHGATAEEEERNVAVVGMRWLPCDMIFERVRSRAVMGVLVLMGLFRLASDKLIATDSSTNCAALGAVQDYSKEQPDVETAESHSDILFWACFLVIGLFNSLYFLRGCWRCVVMLGRFLSVCFAVLLFVNSCWDLTYCHTMEGETFRSFCGGKEAGQIAKCLVRQYDEALDDFGDVSNLHRRLMFLLGGRRDLCDPIVNRTFNDPSVCGLTSPFKSPDLLRITCARTGGCFNSFESHPTTVVRAIIWHCLIWGLLAALCWDTLLRRRLAGQRRFVQVGGVQVSDVPFHANRVARRVPLALLLAWLLEVVWTTDAFVLGVYNILTLAPEGMGIRTIVTSFVHSFLWAQFGIFTLAIVYNVRVYWQHSDELAALPWEELKHDSTAPEPEGWEGVSLTRFRAAGQRSAAVYLGAAWASLHIGSMICSVILSVATAMVTACVKLPVVRTLMWKRVLSPLVTSVCTSIFTLVFDQASRKCLWGERGQFPRRAGCLVLCDLLQMVCGFAASAAIAITRVVKSLIASVLGLLSVTNPGAHELTVLADGIHQYYLYVLWQERFKLEVDRGGIEVQEPVRGCGPCWADCARFMTIVILQMGFVFGFIYFGEWLMVSKPEDGTLPEVPTIGGNGSSG